MYLPGECCHAVTAQHATDWTGCVCRIPYTPGNKTLSMFTACSLQAQWQKTYGPFYDCTNTCIQILKLDFKYQQWGLC